MKICKKKISVVAIVLMCTLVFAFPETCDAKSATLTQAEKEHFSKYLKGGIEYDEDLYYYSSKKQGDLYDAKFFVYDINGDGHKDVIVSGMMGLRSASFS